jgi:hypothetical protein
MVYQVFGLLGGITNTGNAERAWNLADCRGRPVCIRAMVATLVTRTETVRIMITVKAGIIRAKAFID